MIPGRYWAGCEYCGGTVSVSREKGDATNPIDLRSFSPAASFFHTQCADDYQRWYVARRFRRSAGAYVQEFETKTAHATLRGRTP